MDTLECISNIRLLTDSGDLANIEQIRSFQQDLIQASKPIINRLEKCDQLLQRGLRSEALHLAKQEPDLLDLANQLEFKDRDSWESAITLYGLEKAPRPSKDVLEALNRAFSEEEPLRPLLVKYRLAALQKAPYVERMYILREMLEAEPGNIAFQEDMSQFEVLRLKEVRKDFEEAKNSRNTVKIGQIAKELAANTWITAPPDDLVKEATKVLESINKDQLSSKARQIAVELVDNFKRRNEVGCRNALIKLEEICTNLGWGVVDNPAINATAIIHWLESVDKKRSTDFEMELACGDLEEQLKKKDVTEKELLETYEKISYLGKLPPKLEALWNEKYEELKSKRQFREYSILGSLLVFGGLCVITFIIYMATRGRD
jgi:hypothetical protein